MADSPGDLPVWMWSHVAGAGPGPGHTDASLLAAACCAAGYRRSAWRRVVQAVIAGAAGLADG